MHQTQGLTFVPLARVLLPQQTWARDWLLVGAGSLAVALLAQVSLALPFTPVPITGQTLGVHLVGAALGCRLGFWSLVAYLLEGAVGLPVFAGGSAGLLKFVGPTAGYLLAFPLAAALVGYLVERYGADRRLVKTLLAMISGDLLIYALGASWLGVWLSGTEKFQGVEALLVMGVLPFIPGGLLKAALSALLLPTAWKFVSKR